MFLPPLASVYPVTLLVYNYYLVSPCITGASLFIRVLVVPLHQAQFMCVPTDP